MTLLHAIKLRDEVTGAFQTRCGLSAMLDQRALPMPAHARQRFTGGGIEFFRADEESKVSCPKCQLRVSPTERKVLRLMLDYERRYREVVFVTNCPKFDWHAGTDLTFYGRGNLLEGLVRKGLVVGSLDRNHALSRPGRSLAVSYPVVVDEFDVRRKKSKSRYRTPRCMKNRGRR